MSDTNDDDYDDDQITSDEEQDDHNDEITSEGEVSEDEDEQSQQDDDQEAKENEEEQQDDIESFEQGLTYAFRSVVREARRYFFERQEERIRPVIHEEVKHDIDEEWKGIATLPDLQSTTFDFQVLRNLLESDKPDSKSLAKFSSDGTSSLGKKKMEQLQAKQRGDSWRYDIGIDQDDDESDGEDETIDDLE